MVINEVEGRIQIEKLENFSGKDSHRLQYGNINPSGEIILARLNLRACCGNVLLKFNPLWIEMDKRHIA